MVPAPLALDVVTTAPSTSRPGPQCDCGPLVAHHARCRPSARGGSRWRRTRRTRRGRGGCIGPEPVMLGGLLAAQPDGRLDTKSGFLLRSALDAAGKRYWMLQPASQPASHVRRRPRRRTRALGVCRSSRSPGGRPRLCSRPRGRGSIRAARWKDPTSEAGRSGGFHGVCVLDFTPPTEEPPEERTAPAGGRRPLEFGTWRRAHRKPGVRIGICDSASDDLSVRSTRTAPCRARHSLVSAGSSLAPGCAATSRWPRLAPTTAVYEPSNSAAPRGC